MAITRERNFEGLRINPQGQIHVNWSVVYKDDGVEDHRTAKELFIDVEDDVTTLPNIVQDICTAAWKPAVVAARLQAINDILTSRGLPAEATLAAAKATLAGLQQP